MEECIDLKSIVMKELELFEGSRGLVIDGTLVANGVEIKVCNLGNGGRNQYTTRNETEESTLEKMKEAARRVLYREDALDTFTIYMDKGSTAEDVLPIIKNDLEIWKRWFH
tara:strand:- start:37 stop:369 length:333 start_codon:yes stop_codon:yes gene_type:complete